MPGVVALWLVAGLLALIFVAYLHEFEGARRAEDQAAASCKAGGDVRRHR
jgi:hypothetical protein